MEPPRLDRADVCLRPIRPHDAESWFTYLSDPLVTELTSYDIRRISDVSTMIAGYLAAYEEGQLPRWAIARQSDDSLIGTCGFHSWSARDQRAEIGYDLSPDYWNRGIATQALAATLHAAFATTDLNRAEAVVMVENVASQRVLEKCGFHKEGRLRQLRNCRGTFRDFYIYSCLRDSLDRPGQIR
jgi:[ribosomal protein S5]-alanine N-acetyltransferase